MMMILRVITILSALLLCMEASAKQEKSPTPAPAQAYIPAPGHWPQWRGANRDNVSTETGLLKEWPERGPKLLWKAEGLGEGVGCLSVAGGLVFLQGYRDEKEFVTAIDGAGRIVWTVPIGPAVKETSVMRWLSQRTPTVDDDRVYSFTARGVLTCLRSSDGKVLWQIDYEWGFRGRGGHWGYCDFPLVDGDKLICTPGGPKATIVALDKKSGATIWACDIPENHEGTHSSPIVCELGGVRQYVNQLNGVTVGVSAENGKLLWSYPLASTFGPGQGNVHTAILWKKDSLVTLCGWGVGFAILEFPPDRGGTQYAVKHRVFPGNAMKVDGQHQPFGFASWYGSTFRVGDRLYAAGSSCIDLESGTALPAGRLGYGITVTFADGLFYLRGPNAKMFLVEAGPEEMRKRSEFEASQRREQTLTFPVLAGGRLYLRDQGDLYCYDVRGPDYKEPAKVWDILSKATTQKENAPAPVLKTPSGGPDAIFVATPQDVVDHMLDLGRVTKDDVVFDLGSGDGRILITASGKRRCRSVGFEIDPKLVRESRKKAKEAKLDTLVTIEEQDLFKADLRDATVVTLYLGAQNNERLIPQLLRLKPGSRLVSHAHLLGKDGPKPYREVTVISEEDQLEHTIYLWRIEDICTPLFLEAQEKRESRGLKKPDLEVMSANAIEGFRTWKDLASVCAVIKREGIGKSYYQSAIPGLLKYLRDRYSRPIVSGVLAGLGATEEAAAEIQGLMRDPKYDDQRGSLVEALAQLRAVETFPDFLKVLNDPDPQNRRGAARGLASLRRKEAVPELLKLLGDSDASVRGEAVQLLIPLGGKIWVPDILKLHSSTESDHLRQGAGEALFALGATETLPEIVRLLKHENPGVRSSAARTLGVFGAKETIPDVRNLLQDSAPDVRLGAILSLEKLGEKDLTLEIVKVLRDTRPFDRKEASLALWRFTERESEWPFLKEVIPDVVNVLSDPDPDVRLPAYFVLRFVGVHEAVPETMNLLARSGQKVSWEPIQLLGDLGAKESASEIMKHLSSSNPKVRSRSAVVLGLLRTKEAGPLMHNLLADAEHDVRQCAAGALGRLDDVESIPRLIPLLKDSDPWVRTAAAEALCRLGRREGVDLLLKEGGSLAVLNSIRRPDRVNGLKLKTWSQQFRGTLPEILHECALKIAAEDGMKFTLDKTFPAQTGKCWVPAGRSLLDELEEATVMAGFVAIIESEEIQVIPREEAVAFWKSWWASEKGK